MHNTNLGFLHKKEGCTQEVLMQNMSEISANLIDDSTNIKE